MIAIEKCGYIDNSREMWEVWNMKDVYVGSGITIANMN